MRTVFGMVLVRTLAVAAVFGLVVAALLAVTLVVCLGPNRIRSVSIGAVLARDRLRQVAPYAGALVTILALNKGLREWTWALSDLIGYEATGLFYRVEGDLAAAVQTAIPDAAAVYFVAVYMFGYGLVLVAPIVLYLFAESLRPLKTLLAAYTINYAVGIAVYVVVIAHGPRIASDSSKGIIQEAFPYFTLLTGQVNSPTNVFPSLHTSMSVTVLALAVLTRDQFPRWLTIAAALTPSIVVATVYLGIHWLIDVLAGVVLAVAAVAAARRIVNPDGRSSRTRSSGATRE